MEQPNVKFMHMNVYGRSERDYDTISHTKGIPFATLGVAEKKHPAKVN